MGWVRLILVSVLMVSSLQPAPAHASVVHLDVEAGTELPISVGVNLGLELPKRFRFSTGLGYLPADYVSLINAVVESFPDTYDAATGDLIEQTLQDALIWRTHFGWAMASGAYLDAGYGLATLGGGTSTEALLLALLPEPPPSSGMTTNYDVSSTLHMFDLEAGWKTVFAKDFTFRAAIGLAATVAASATVEATSAMDGVRRQRLIDQFETATEKYLVDTYTTYVITPVFTFAVGYRLF